MATAATKSGPFSSFWHRSKDKISPTKVKFMPNVTNPGNDKPAEDPAAAALAAKQHRRAQVRKAQIEHRQRKANYVKHLEQDVIDLREMISTTETEASVVKQENDAIRKALSKTGIPVSSPEQDPFIINFQPQNDPSQSLAASLPDLQDVLRQSDSSMKSMVSVNFDDTLKASCLHMNPLNTYDPSPEILNSPDIFGSFNSPNSLTSPQSAVPSSKSPQKAPSPQAKTQSRNPKQDMSTTAINFILALEHPCRTHFHPHQETFDPSGDASGHELMASTLLFSSAPAPVFSSLDSAQWEGSGVSLETLYAMSKSLPKGDFEITPVQAWFLLSERFGVKRLLETKGVLEGLKKGLGKLVKCFAFGAVMEEGGFWEVVEGVLGPFEERELQLRSRGQQESGGWI